MNTKITKEEIFQALIQHRLQKHVEELCHNANKQLRACRRSSFPGKELTPIDIAYLQRIVADICTSDYKDTDKGVINNPYYKDTMPHFQALHDAMLLEIGKSPAGSWYEDIPSSMTIRLCFPVESILDTCACWQEHIACTATVDGDNSHPCETVA